jgi:hypothetical protein
MFFLKSSYRIYLKLALLAVYFIFFAVQIFFSFYSGKNVLYSNHYSNRVYSAGGNNPATALTGNQNKTAHPASFRLNKHFQPQYLPSGLFPRIKIPVEYISVRNLIPYSVDFISSQFPCSSALRGPPAMNSIS